MLDVSKKYDVDYFIHLYEEQKRRFVEKMNDKSIKLSYPGRFYVAPYFCTEKANESKNQRTLV